MKTILFLLGFILCMQGISAQEPCKSYASLPDLLNGTSDSSLKVLFEKRNKNQIFMSGGGDYRIYNGDKEIDKAIKTGIFAVEVNDSLYINCRGLRFKKHVIGAWFAPGMICQGKVYFTAIPVGPSAAVAFGLVGGVAQAANAASNRAYYVIDDSEKKLKLDKIGSEKMKEMLNIYPELLEQYNKEAFKEET